MQNSTERNLNTYDYHAKNILKEKNILVHLIKAFVPEFRDMPVQDIRQYIGLDPGEVDNDLISQSGIGVDYEDEFGKITSDISFELKLPDGCRTDVRFMIMMDIEPQDYRTKYSPVKRGIVNISKMISSQQGRYYSRMHYENVQQVYSIWICFNPPRKEAGTIRTYSFSETNILGDYHEEKEEYDLAKVIVINLGRSADDTDAKTKGEYYNEDIENTLRILNTIFVSREPAKKIIDDLTQYGVRTTDTMDGEVETMGYLGDVPYHQGLNEGFDKGMAKGIEKNSIDTAMRMIGMASFDDDTISSVSGLPIEKVRELKASQTSDP